MGHVRPHEQGSERMRCHVCTFLRATIRSGMPVSDHARNRTCGKQGPAGTCILVMTTAQSMCRPSTSRQLPEPCTAIWSQRPSSGCGPQDHRRNRGAVLAVLRRHVLAAAAARRRCRWRGSSRRARGALPGAPLAGLQVVRLGGHVAGRAHVRRHLRARSPASACTPGRHGAGMHA